MLMSLERIQEKWTRFSVRKRDQTRNLEHFHESINLVLAVLLGVLVSFGIIGPAWADLRADKPTILITGSNRGLGLEFARQYAAKGWNVIATCRRPEEAEDLKALALEQSQVVIEKVDVTSDGDVVALALKYRDQPVDILLNNAGIYGDVKKQKMGALEFDELEKVFAVNTFGPLRMSQAFLENVAVSEQKKIISLGGGIGTPRIGPLVPDDYFFKMSKAAHLMAMATLQAKVRKRGIIVSMISPGMVATQHLVDSGYTGKSISAAESAALVIEQIGRLDDSLGGKLINYNGKITPY